jgi:myo-inositol 2-dehydrogenase/D-chiro-inositol 1-dehydrogenase
VGRVARDAVRLGLIGCGTVAREYHWPRWDRLERARVTAVTDLRPELAEAAGERFGARVYANHRALIEDADIDALYILIPPFAHTDQELLAVERGLPFFVEKPVGLDLGRVREVAAALERRSVITSVGYNWRYSRPVTLARSLLAGRTVGLVSGYWLGGGAHGTLPEWWGDPSRSGGQLVEQTTHIVDLLRYLGGEVRAVHCRQGHRLVNRPGFDVPDVSTMQVEFVSGALGSLVSSCSLPRGTWRAGIEVTADGVFLQVGLDSLRVHRGGPPEEHVADPDDVPNNPYLLEDQVFVDAVRTGDAAAIRSSYADAARTLAISLAANESARTGERVELPAD